MNDVKTTNDPRAWITQIRVGKDSLNKIASEKQLDAAKDPNDQGTVAIAMSTEGTPGNVQNAPTNANASSMDPTNPMLSVTNPQTISENPAIPVKDGNADEAKFTDPTSPLGKKAAAGAQTMLDFITNGAATPAAPAASKSTTTVPGTASTGSDQTKEAQVYPSQVPMEMMFKLATFCAQNEEIRTEVESILTKAAGAEAVSAMIGEALAEKVAYDTAVEAYYTKRAAVHNPLLDSYETEGEKVAHIAGANLASVIITEMLSGSTDGLKKMAADMAADAEQISAEDIMTTIELLAQNGDIDPAIAEQLMAAVTEGDIEGLVTLVFAAMDSGQLDPNKGQQLLMSFGMSPEDIAAAASAMTAAAQDAGAELGAEAGMEAGAQATEPGAEAAMLAEQEAMKTANAVINSAFEGII